MSSRCPKGQNMKDGKCTKYEMLWSIQQYYSTYGWEEVFAEERLDEARQRAKEYRENQPEYPVRIKRVKSFME